MSSDQSQRLRSGVDSGLLFVSAKCGEDDIGQAASEQTQGGDAVLAAGELLLYVGMTGTDTTCLSNGDHV